MNDFAELRERNSRVEADKAWETGWTRRLLIAAGTYLVVALYLSVLGVEGAVFHAAVPPCAYLISTLTLPLVKKFWLVNFYEK